MRGDESIRKRVPGWPGIEAVAEHARPRSRPHGAGRASRRQRLLRRLARPGLPPRLPSRSLRAWLSMLLCVALLAAPGGPTTVGAASPGRDLPSWVDVPDSVYFAETGHHLAEPFLFHWRMNGDRTVFGLPISEPSTLAAGRWHGDPVLRAAGAAIPP